MDENARADYAAVVAAIGSPDRLGVAFSGGVDSAVLLAVSATALGPERVVAILAVSPSLPERERFGARDIAASLGVELVELETAEIDEPGYRANGGDRCYHCKRELFTRIDEEVRTRYGLSKIAYGENADDLVREDRPGSRSAAELGVTAPLALAGLSKFQVRRLARNLGLSVADKPASPCLASRVPFGEPITEDKLSQISRAETFLHRLGFDNCRVRHHGNLARIEVPDCDIEKLAAVRKIVQTELREIGFNHISLDLGGLQSGRFAELILERK